MKPLLLFFVGSLYFLWISRRALGKPRSHGFYRFFAFETILLLVALNQPFWFTVPFSPPHLLSWTLLAASIVFVAWSLLLLRRKGGHAGREDMPENFSFENTVRVVDEGIYGVIRHPMYGSLLLLGWGAFLKHVTPTTSLLVLLATGLLYAVAKVEERENLRFFGKAYREYMQRTRMFIPWFF